MKPLILVTNDDGVLSPGLKAAAEAVDDLGELFIVAPRFQQTAMSRAFPRGEDIGIIETLELDINGKKHLAYGVHGSPAHAVAHGVLELTSRKPDICVSGINYGENLGSSLFPSGTIGAALEANTYGIPGLAMNLEASISMHTSSSYDRLEWETAMYFTSHFAKKILHRGLPYKTALLNVNIPSVATKHTPISLTVQSKQDYFVFVKPSKRDLSKAFRLKVEMKVNEDTLEQNSDIYAFAINRYISVTPVTWDLTSKDSWDDLEMLLNI